MSCGHSASGSHFMLLLLLMGIYLMVNVYADGRNTCYHREGNVYNFDATCTKGDKKITNFYLWDPKLTCKGKATFRTSSTTNAEYQIVLNFAGCNVTVASHGKFVGIRFQGHHATSGVEMEFSIDSKIGTPDPYSNPSPCLPNYKKVQLNGKPVYILPVTSIIEIYDFRPDFRITSEYFLSEEEIDTVDITWTEETGLNLWIIIVIVVGSVSVILLLAICCCICCCKQSKSKPSVKNVAADEDINPVSARATSTTLESKTPKTKDIDAKSEKTPAAATIRVVKAKTPKQLEESSAVSQKTVKSAKSGINDISAKQPIIIIDTKSASTSHKVIPNKVKPAVKTVPGATVQRGYIGGVDF